jgi:hypothetical protein
VSIRHLSAYDSCFPALVSNMCSSICPELKWRSCMKMVPGEWPDDGSAVLAAATTRLKTELVGGQDLGSVKTKNNLKCIFAMNLSIMILGLMTLILMAFSITYEV